MFLLNEGLYTYRKLEVGFSVIYATNLQMYLLRWRMYDICTRAQFYPWMKMTKFLRNPHKKNHQLAHASCIFLIIKENDCK